MKNKSQSNIYTVLIVTVVLEIKNSKDYIVEPRAEDVLKNQREDNDNKETVGWVRVQGTNIDFPVLYAPGYDFSYETGKFGWTEAKFKELNNIVYIEGHNIKNMSTNPLIADESHDRFEQLMSFAYYDFAKENQFIQYTFNGVDYLYKIYSVDFIDESDLDLYNEIEYSEEDMREFINTTIRKSIEAKTI